MTLKNKISIEIGLILLLLPICPFGCGITSSSSIPTHVYFPVQNTAQTINMEARMEGHLVIDKAGYLKVVEANALIIWPFGYSLRHEGNDIWVITNEDKAVARVGDTVVLGGGFVGASVGEEKIGHALPTDATGPYFLCGRVVE